MRNIVYFKEVVELFLNNTIYELKSEKETPDLNFIFNEAGIQLFTYIKNNPFILQNRWTPNISNQDIEFLLNRRSKNAPTIFVNDSIIFFETLTKIINSQMQLYNEYGEQKSARQLLIQILRRIWLRMGVDDIRNVNLFLNKQLQFVKNRIFDSYKFEKKVSSFFDYDVSAICTANRTWDESTRSMHFKIHDNDSNYELPKILFDIDNDNVCYIYGIQNDTHENKDKKIERLLYKLNKGINEPNQHPSRVYAMIQFINLLKQHGITKIKIPGLQVLSYRYHELLSKNSKKEYAKICKELSESENNKYLLEKYDWQLEWYKHVADKEDEISFSKTESLVNLIYRLTLHDNQVKVMNEINLQGDYIYLKIKK